MRGCNSVGAIVLGQLLIRRNGWLCSDAGLAVREVEFTRVVLKVYNNSRMVVDVDPEQLVRGVWGGDG